MFGEWVGVSEVEGEEDGGGGVFAVGAAHEWVKQRCPNNIRRLPP